MDKFKSDYHFFKVLTSILILRYNLDYSDRFNFVADQKYEPITYNTQINAQILQILSQYFSQYFRAITH